MRLYLGISKRITKQNALVTSDFCLCDVSLLQVIKTLHPIPLYLVYLSNSRSRKKSSSLRNTSSSNFHSTTTKHPMSHDNKSHLGFMDSMCLGCLNFTTGHDRISLLAAIKSIQPPMPENWHLV